MAISFSASLRPTRARILLIALAVALLLGYGLFTAQRARSATLTKKAFAGVKISGGLPSLVHPSHVTGVTRLATGQWKVMFDRHVDNCSFATTVDYYGGILATDVFLLFHGQDEGYSTSDEVVESVNPSTHAPTDSDFDIIALCPGT